MHFDGRQFDTLRTALRAHRAYTTGRSGPGLTWLELAADIEVYTGAVMSPEVLRQFVEGVSKKEFPVRFRVPSPENLEAITAYLTNPHIDALAPDELEPERFAWQAPLRLIEYLRQELDTEALPLPDTLEGTFQAVAAEAETITAIRLTLRPDRESGFIRVAETADIYASRSVSDFLAWTDRDKRNRHRARTESEGWAVLTPEDNLLFFLKDRPFGRNHYWTLAAEVDLWTGAAVPRLMLLRHDYPAELDEHGADTHQRGPGLPKGIVRHLLTNLFCFERI